MQHSGNPPVPSSIWGGPVWNRLDEGPGSQGMSSIFHFVSYNNALKMLPAGHPLQPGHPGRGIPPPEPWLVVTGALRHCDVIFMVALWSKPGRVREGSRYERNDSEFFERRWIQGNLRWNRWVLFHWSKPGKKKKILMFWRLEHERIFQVVLLGVRLFKGNLITWTWNKWRK